MTELRSEDGSPETPDPVFDADTIMSDPGGELTPNSQLRASTTTGMTRSLGPAGREKKEEDDQSTKSKDEDEEAEPPAQLGRYAITAELGRGGMGVVYAARDDKLERKVAIKVLRAAGHEQRRRRLVREAQAMARLSHPNVCGVYEIGESEGMTFIVMEYVTGQTLRGWLAAEPRTNAEILAVFEAAARGLIAAHAKGLIHRDFKPDNVMVDEEGRVRVMDFGLARADDERLAEILESTIEDEPAWSMASEQLTRSGTLLGSPAYMAPEQLRIERATILSDQFSFCTALYQALYGERPFAGRTLSELRAALLDEELRPPRPGSTVPAWLRALVVRGLAYWPEDRYASMEALLEAVEAAKRDRDPDARDPKDYVFVAHASVDKREVLQLCTGLLDCGVRPWIDIWDQVSAKEAAAALAKAPAILLCTDPSALSPSEAGLVRARLEREPDAVVSVALPAADRRAPRPDEPELELDADDWRAGVVALAARFGVDHERDRWLAAEARSAGVELEALCPYRGLEAFRAQDARWMFGRDEEIDDLLALIRAGEARFLTLIGASGSGKSSLVMAGVYPALRHGILGDGGGWTLAQLRPGTRPCESLALALSEAIDFEASPDALRLALIDDPGTLARLVVQASTPRILIVIDQLEELFTEARLGSVDASIEAMAFVRNLIGATQQSGTSNLWVVATLRADFVQRCLEVAELARALKGGTYFALPPMGEAQLRAAIERPAARVGYRVEPSLVDTLVAAAANQAGRLPLLQHVLRELWQRRDREDRVLPHRVYAETGGLEGAIATAAERGLASSRRELGDEADRLTRRVMTRLVHLGRGTSGDTRRRAGIDELGTGPETRRVLDVLVGEARVLVASAVDGVEVFEIAHEALLREWTTLVTWLDADREALRLRQELATDAEQVRPGIDEREYLWPKGRVEEARRVLAASMVGLNETERAFLERSAAVSRTRERRIRILVAGFMILALAVVGVVLGLNRQIRQQSEALSAQKLMVEDQVRAQQRSLSKQRGLRARMLIPEDREREALLLAVQAVGAYGPDWTEEPPAEARVGLEQVLANDAFIVSQSRMLSEHEGELRALTHSPRSAELVTASVDGRARIFDRATGRLRATLGEAGSSLNAVDYSPDGRELVIAGVDGRAQIFDADGGQPGVVLDARAGELLDVRFAPDGVHVATASVDGHARVFMAETGALVQTFGGHQGSVRELAWAPDAALLATASEDRSARFFDVETGALVHTFVHDAELTGIAFAPDGARFATISKDGITRLWRVDSGELLAALDGHDNGVIDLAFSVDGARLATAGWDNSARIWDVESGAELAHLGGHANIVNDLAWAPDGSQLATASKDGSARIWDATSGRQLASFEGHARAVIDIAYAVDGTRVSSVSEAGIVHVWNPWIDNPVATREGHRSVVYALAYAPEGRALASASFDGSARIWDPDSGRLRASLVGHQNLVFNLAYSPDGSRIATASWDHSARIWDPSGEMLARLEGHEDVVYGLTWAPSGEQLATTSVDGTARIWDAESGDLVATLRGHESTVFMAAYAPNGVTLASVGFDGVARLWDSASAELRATLPGHEGPLLALSWAPDGTHFVTAGADQRVLVRDGRSGELRAELRGHAGAITRAIHSPDGETLATASDDNTVRLWDPVSGAQLATLAGHDGALLDIAYAPDGSMLATSSRDGTAKVWDRSGEQLLATLVGHSGEINALAFSSDGRQLATGSDDHTVKIWDPRTGELLMDLVDRIGVRRDDGTIDWPVPAPELTRIGCERLRPFAPEYAEVAEICD